MGCEFKDGKEGRLCRAIYGECQFLKAPYDEQCPIRAQFRELPKEEKKESKDKEN